MSAAVGYLRNATALVTGAGNGIGKGISLMMGARGTRVGVADLNLAAAEKTAKEIEARGGIAIPLKMDVTDEDQVNSTIEKLANELGNGRLDVLVANAGIQHIEPIIDLEFANWKKILDVHLNGSFLTTRAAMRKMKIQVEGRSGGRIIFIGSVHSKEASVLKAPYVTAKHGVMGLMKSVAKEGAEYGISSNTICPGFVLTDLVIKQIPEQAKTLGISEEDVKSKVMLKNTVDGVFTTIDEVAEAVCFMADQTTCTLSGQSLTVSHGWNMS